MDKLIIKIKIQPNSSKNEIIQSENEIKIKLTAQPVNGKANKALIEFLSKSFKIPKTSIEIIKGLTNKEKTLSFNISDKEKLNFIKNIFTK